MSRGLSPSRGFGRSDRWARSIRGFSSKARTSFSSPETKSVARYISADSGTDTSLRLLRELQIGYPNTYSLMTLFALSSGLVKWTTASDSDMDLVLNVADHYVLTPYVYPSSWPEDGALRQIISLLVVTNLGAAVLYLGLGWLSYHFIFDHNLMKHPQFLKNQVRREIKYAMTSLPIISIPTVALFFLEVRGYSKLYDHVEESPMGWPFVLLSMISFLLFTDGCIYWIHRFLHHKSIYKHFHKPHHVWKIPTPFASHAFHPLDGFLQGLPYHIYPFLFPLHKVLYLALYIFVNIWTVSIHDGDYRVPGPLQEVVNGAAHHTDHHLFFDVNYGQYFTLWDRIGGSYRNPSVLEGKGPLDCIRRLTAEGKMSANGANANGHTNGHANVSGTKSKEE